MKKILIPLLIILVLALGSIVIILTNSHITEDTSLGNLESSYRATFLESDGKTRTITLKLFKKNFAEMITDPDTTPSSTLPDQVEMGTWKQNSDGSQLYVILDSHEESLQYDSASRFTFSKTEMGIEAVQYDHERYPYSFMDFIEI